jgi:hypothetical protein
MGLAGELVKRNGPGFQDNLPVAATVNVRAGRWDVGVGIVADQYVKQVVGDRRSYL